MRIVCGVILFLTFHTVSIEARPDGRASVPNKESIETTDSQLKPRALTSVVGSCRTDEGCTKKCKTLRFDYGQCIEGDCSCNNLPASIKNQLKRRRSTTPRSLSSREASSSSYVSSLFSLVTPKGKKLKMVPLSSLIYGGDSTGSRSPRRRSGGSSPVRSRREYSARRRVGSRSRTPRRQSRYRTPPRKSPTKKGYKSPSSRRKRAGTKSPPKRPLKTPSKRKSTSKDGSRTPSRTPRGKKVQSAGKKPSPKSKPSSGKKSSPKPKPYSGKKPSPKPYSGKNDWMGYDGDSVDSGEDRSPAKRPSSSKYPSKTSSPPPTPKLAAGSGSKYPFTLPEGEDLPEKSNLKPLKVPQRVSTSIDDHNDGERGPQGSTGKPNILYNDNEDEAEDEERDLDPITKNGPNAPGPKKFGKNNSEPGKTSKDSPDDDDDEDEFEARKPNSKGPSNQRSGLNDIGDDDDDTEENGDLADDVNRQKSSEDFDTDNQNFLNKAGQKPAVTKPGQKAGLKPDGKIPSVGQAASKPTDGKSAEGPKNKNPVDPDDEEGDYGGDLGDDPEFNVMNPQAGAPAGQKSNGQMPPQSATGNSNSKSPTGDRTPLPKNKASGMPDDDEDDDSIDGSFEDFDSSFPEKPDPTNQRRPSDQQKLAGQTKPNPSKQNPYGDMDFDDDEPDDLDESANNGLPTKPSGGDGSSNLADPSKLAPVSGQPAKSSQGSRPIADDDDDDMYGVPSGPKNPTSRGGSRDPYAGMDVDDDDDE